MENTQIAKELKEMCDSLFEDNLYYLARCITHGSAVDAMNEMFEDMTCLGTRVTECLNTSKIKLSTYLEITKSMARAFAIACNIRNTQNKAFGRE